MQKIRPQSRSSVLIKKKVSAILNSGFSFLTLRGKLLKILIPE